MIKIVLRFYIFYFFDNFWNKFVIYLRDNFNNFTNIFIKKSFNKIIYGIKFHDKFDVMNIAVKD